jgi:hypothetical protein
MITLRNIATAILGFSASMGALALGLLVAFDGIAQLNLDRTLGVLGLTAATASGYGLSLWLARRRFRADAQLGGRRDLVAGALAVVLLLAASVATQGAPLPLRLTLCLASGVLAAMAAHLPWLQRRRMEQRV